MVIFEIKNLKPPLGFGKARVTVYLKQWLPNFIPLRTPVDDRGLCEPQVFKKGSEPKLYNKRPRIKDTTRKCSPKIKNKKVFAQKNTQIFRIAVRRLLNKNQIFLFKINPLFKLHRFKQNLNICSCDLLKRQANLLG